MAKPKFSTVEGSSSLTTDKYYVGVLQNEQTLTKKETYAWLADKLGFTATVIESIFSGLAQYIKSNQANGNITLVDAIMSVRNSIKGAFATLVGPWDKNVNYIQTGVVAIDNFKDALKGIVPTNVTGGASPVVNSVLDTVTGLYDIIKGTDKVSIAGSDLEPDSTATDEGVFLVNSSTGTETKLTVTKSTLTLVEANLATALTAGDYRIEVRTRSGYGEEFGLKVASRAVSYVAA